MGRLSLISGFFLAYGFASGLAFLAILNHQVNEARSETLAAVYLALPVNALSELKI